MTAPVLEMVLAVAPLHASPSRTDAPPLPPPLHELLFADEAATRRAAALDVRAIAADLAPVFALLDADCRGDRYRAARAFRDVRVPAAVDRLVVLVLHDDDPHVRAMAANAIAASDLERGASLLRQALASAPASAFEHALYAIDTMHGSSAHRTLTDAVRAARLAAHRQT